MDGETQESPMGMNWTLYALPAAAMKPWVTESFMRTTFTVDLSDPADRAAQEEEDGDLRRRLRADLDAVRPVRLFALQKEGEIVQRLLDLLSPDLPFAGLVNGDPLGLAMQDASVGVVPPDRLRKVADAVVGGDLGKRVAQLDFGAIPTTLYAATGSAEPAKRESLVRLVDQLLSFVAQAAARGDGLLCELRL
jgi:hypothetical protein